MSDFSFNSKLDITCMPCHIENVQVHGNIHDSFSLKKIIKEAKSRVKDVFPLRFEKISDKTKILPF